MDTVTNNLIIETLRLIQLMKYKSEPTLGLLSGNDRLYENKKFTELLNKPLLNEDALERALLKYGLDTERITSLSTEELTNELMKKASNINGKSSDVLIDPDSIIFNSKEDAHKEARYLQSLASKKLDGKKDDRTELGDKYLSTIDELSEKSKEKSDDIIKSLINSGHMKLINNNYVLTDLGIQAGGKIQTGKIGDNIVWPDNILLSITKIKK
jgi:hypothetical protein